MDKRECARKLGLKLEEIVERHASPTIGAWVKNKILELLGYNVSDFKVTPKMDEFIASARAIELHAVTHPLLIVSFSAWCCKLEAKNVQCKSWLIRLWEAGAYMCPNLIAHFLRLLEQGRETEALVIARNPKPIIEKWIVEGRCYRPPNTGSSLNSSLSSNS